MSNQNPNPKSNTFTLTAISAGVIAGFGLQFYIFPKFINSSDLVMASPTSDKKLNTNAEESNLNLHANKSSAGTQNPHLQARESTFITCGTIRERTSDFVKMHYSIREFGAEMSTRSLSKFFQSLDPGKNYFTEADIASFKNIETKLGKNINNMDCRFIADIWSIYLKRVQESESYIDIALAKPFNFTTEDRLETDRKKIAWASGSAELKERWRKLLKFVALGMKETEADPQKIATRLRKRYQLGRKSLLEKNMDDVNGIYLNAFALSLDPHSGYQMPEEQSEFKVQFSLQLVGIGASLTQQDGYTIVDSVIPGGPASRDGRLRKGDKIFAVDSGDGAGFTDVVDMDLSKVVSLIRGKKDTLVKLNLLRKGEKSEVERVTLDLIRDIVHLADSEAHSDVMNIGGKKIGVINFPSFYIDYAGSRSDKNYRSSANDMAREIKNLKAKNVDGILVDLRRNGGGDLSECIKITGHFIDAGPVVQVQQRNGDVESLNDTDAGTLYNGPLGVLISRQSASASEIFSGAIQDYGRGLIMGNTRTYGKATVQHVIEVPGTKNRESDGALKVTISKFFRPSGRSNQERGVPSDIVIPDILDTTDLSEAENDYVLPYTTIPAQKLFSPVQNLTPILETLRKKSEERLKSNKDFKEIFEAIAKAKAEKDKTSISLKAEDMAARLKKKPTPNPKDSRAATATPAPGKDKAEAAGREVIRDEDVELKEAGAILVDSIGLLGQKTDWAH